MNNTASKAPERTIDYIDKYLSYINDEERAIVMKAVSLAYLEGKKHTLKDLARYYGKTKDIERTIRRELALSINILRAWCYKYAIFYEKK